MKSFRMLALILLAAALGGCGGSSSSTPAPTGPVASTLSFPLQAAYKSFVATGATKNFTVSGSCNGSGTYIWGAAATPATFETVPGFSGAESGTMSLTNCTPSSLAITGVNYYDTNYNPLGYIIPASTYAVYQQPFVIPGSVRVGNTGFIGRVLKYTNSSKAVSSGWEDYSYMIEADTANTAVVNLIQKDYNASGVMTSTTQTRYRIGATGGLTPISDDTQLTTLHLVLTYQ